MSSSHEVLYERRSDGVAVLTLNRPERLNAMTPSMRAEYLGAMAEAGADDAVRAIVVTGSGAGFCAGADFKALESATSDRVRAQADEAYPIDVARHVPKPVIAAINGAVAGVGLCHALMADIRIAAPDAKFTTSFARLGMVAELGSSWLLPRIVGRARAFELMCSARVFTGQEAFEYGLVDGLVERDAVLDRAIEYAVGLIASSSAYSIAQIKEQIRLDETSAWEDSLAASIELAAQACEREEFRSRARAR